MTAACCVGIDIGSTASKVAVLRDGELAAHFVLPTGWSGKDAAARILERLEEDGFAAGMRCVATGYGRVCVDYADKVVTEITCHGKGAWYLFGRACTVVDVGGQDTKVITVENGLVTDFVMNDKCAAGTGKFVEVMANRLGVSLEELFALAATGEPVGISAMCTVFAESEVISHIGAGQNRADIASGIVKSVASKVANLAARQKTVGDAVLTGGLSASPYFVQVLAAELGRPVHTHPLAAYAGALGAALTAANLRG